MGLDLSLSGFVGAGGGVAYVLVALLVAVSGGPRTTRLLFATTVGAQGIVFGLLSLTTPEPTGAAWQAAVGVGLLLAASIAAAVCAAGLAVVLARATSRRATGLVAGALVALVIFAASIIRGQGGITPGSGDASTVPAYTRVVYAIVLVSYASCAVAVAAVAFQWKASSAPGIALLGVSFAIMPIATLAVGATRSGAQALLAAFAVVCLLAWMPPWRDQGRRIGRAALFGLLAWALVWQSYPLMPESVPNFVGLVGPFWVVAALAMAIALLHHNVWGITPPRPVRRRGGWTAGALASLFIVAQIAQEFLATEYGLLLGGAVAGMLLFAANPIQRAIEQAAERQSASYRGARSGRSQQAFQAAVRATLLDGRMTAEKEEQLAEVAEHLGLGPRDALRIRRQVEAEAERAPAGQTHREAL